MSEERFPATWCALLRHAKSEWNQVKRIQGQMDSPLTREGKRAAERWGRFLMTFRWDRIMTSDARRSLETVSIINRFLKIPVHADIRLREQDWGSWTGKTIEEIRREDPDSLDEQISSGWGFCPPGGEDRLALLRRSRECLRSAADRWPGENILVVTHEGVIKSLIYHLFGRRFVPTEPPIIRSSRLHWVVCERRRMRVGQINIAINARPTTR